MTVSTARMTPLGAVVRGLAAGVAGTAAMTAAQELPARLRSSGGEGDEDAGRQQEDERQSDPWEQASAPAKVARRVIEGVFRRDVSPDAIPLLTHATHWGYGTGWGALYGLLQGSRPGPALRRGVGFGGFVWAMSYVQLVPMGLYEPPWKYSPGDLGMEVGYHLAYGAGLGVAYAALERRT